MKKIILIAIIAFTFLYVGLIDFSYAKGFAKGAAKGAAELTGVEMVQEKSPNGFDERKIEQDADDVVDDDDDVLDDVVDDDDADLEEDEGL